MGIGTRSGGRSSSDLCGVQARDAREGFSPPRQDTIDIKSEAGLDDSMLGHQYASSRMIIGVAKKV